MALKKLVITADNLRDTVGVGSVIKVHSGNHEGFTKRRVETRKIDEIRAADIKPPSKEVWTHPFFGKREGE